MKEPDCVPVAVSHMHDAGTAWVFAVPTGSMDRGEKNDINKMEETETEATFLPYLQFESGAGKRT
jgi:hypothetical protein